MKAVWKEILYAFVLGAVVPGMLIWFGTALMDLQKEQSPGSTLQNIAVQQEMPLYEISVRTGDHVENKSLEDYLVGVVLAEMPASFEEEALKAQAVVARTYTVRADVTGGKHKDGSVCTDYACCQAYIEQEEYLSRGGSADNLEKIRSAVADTAGLVLTYEGQLIEATYFSCSGGSTEDALAVWGTDYPYLKATPSPGEEKAAHFTDTVSFTPDQFQQALGTSFSGTPDSWFGTVTYTEGGGVDSMEIGGRAYKGTKLRQLLSLRSTAFTVSAGDVITITTRGYGHRVGMSQYGADAMAVSGKSSADILAYYYHGTSLVPYSAVGN